MTKELLKQAKGRDAVGLLRVFMDRADMGQSLAPNPPYKVAIASANKIAEALPVGEYALYTTPPAQPVASEPQQRDKVWCEYVAGLIGTYLGEPVDSKRVAAISGIIERRLWALERPASEPMKPWQIMPTVKDRATGRELPVTGVYEDVVFVDLAASEPVAVPQGYPCEIEEADFEANTITVKMLTNDYRIHAGEYRLSAAPSPAPVGIKKENQ